MTIDSDSPKEDIVVGLWRRFWSDSIDAVFLSLVGFLASLPLKDFFYTLGERGWWIGLVVAFIYTGVLHTSIGNGQTVAKRILGIQVVQENGGFLSLPRSFLRYSVIVFIAYNGWIYKGLTATFPLLNATAFGTIFGLLTLLCWCDLVLVLPFHPLRQGLHDLLARSIVIRVGRFDAEKINALGDVRKIKRAYAIGAIGFACLLTFFYWFSLRVPNLAPSFATERVVLEQATHSIENSTSFQNIQGTVTWNIYHPEEKTRIIISAFLPKTQFEDKQFLKSEADKAIGAVIRVLQEPQNYGSIYIVVRSGFNIGIAASYTSKTCYSYLNVPGPTKCSP
jgi:uncharacterized RDD family membrane protein YckC